MGQISFIPYPFLIGLAALLALLWLLRGRSRPAYLLALALLWLYCMLVAAVTLFPIPLPLPLDPIDRQYTLRLTLDRINLVPLYYGGFTPQRIVLREIVRNVLLTVPFGFGVGFVLPLRAWHVPLLGLAAGLAIEGAQLLVSLIVVMNYRAVDINDVLFNALGVIIGYITFRVFTWLYLAAARSMRLRRGFLYEVAEQANRHSATR